MFADLKYIALWWLVITLLGWLSLPLIMRYFSRFWDKGYIFAKIVSVSLITFIIFVLGVFKFLPFSQTSVIAIGVAFMIANYFLLKDPASLENFKKDLRTHLGKFLILETMFFIVLAFWSYIRGFNPDIEGLEKFMDWGFVNSALRSQFMPPPDMWFAGEPINYYYFGHLMFALLTKVSGISSAVTYNLSIATVAALTFVSTFSLTSNLVWTFLSNFKSKVSLSLKPALVAGLLSALLLTFGGNLHTLYKVVKINSTNNNGKVVFSREQFTEAARRYWYPDATRFIGFDPDIKDKTIHEFPIYSFVVADLHGHMNDIPVVVFIVAFLLARISGLKHQKNKPESLIDWWTVVPVGLFLSIAYMTNAWDFAVYGLVFAAVFFFTQLQSGNLLPSIIKTFFNGLVVVVTWYLATLPYAINFTPMAEGLRLSDTHTPFYQLFILYGGFWLLCLPFILFFAKRKFTKGKLEVTDYFVAALVLVATLLIILPEIGYIKDIYIYEHRRANTMFKLVYEAFMLYSLVVGYVLVRFTRSLPTLPKTIYKAVFFLVFIIHMIYPVFAIRSYYNLGDKSFKAITDGYKGLYGFNFLKDRYPDNYAAISWLNKNITGQPIVLEAVGDSYTDFNQVSMSTGLPTVEGWIVHEWLWRGGYDQPAARQSDVEKIYTSKNKDEVRTLLQKYSVDYVFIGDKEYEKYPQLNEKNFSDLNAIPVFESGKTKIYKLIK